MTDDEFDQMFNILFDGVDSLKNDGSPGTIIPVLLNTRAVLCSENPTHVILVAARFGHGRCLIFSHNSYSSMFFDEDNENSQFINNCRQWLSPRSHAEFESIDDYDSFDEASRDGNILVWNGNMNKDDQFVNDLCNYVKSGGSLICSSTLWSWLEGEAGRTLSDFAFAKFCDLMGVKATDTCIECPDRIPVDRDLVEFKNLQNAVRLLETDPRNDQYLDIVAWGSTELRYPAPGLTMETIENVIENSEGQVVPQSKSPIVDKAYRDRSMRICNILRVMPGVKAPGIEEFPGDFKQEPSLETNVEYSVESQYSQWYCTGYYVAAGIPIRIDVLDQTGANGWLARIGCHDDELDKCDQFRRWYSMSITKPLDKQQIRLSSSFGGLLFLQSPEGESNSITVRLHHVVRTPTYDLTDPNRAEKWEYLRNYASGLWSDLAGRYIVFNLPSTSVLHLSSYELDRVLAFWDSVVLTHHDLRGTQPKQLERIVSDEQPCAGYMHSGYPVVTEMNVTDPNSEHFLLNMRELEKKGGWGLFHELGHNMQRDSWTFDGTDEVTVNIFTLHAMEVLCNIETWLHPWLREQIEDTNEYIENGCVFDKWKKTPGVALFIYAQLAREFGWDSYKRVLRTYEQDNVKIDDDQEKIDYWIVTFSREVDRNLVPLFRFWGFPISQSTIDSLDDLEVAEISDQFIELAPERLQI